MRRILIVLAVAAGLGVGVAGTAAAAPAAPAAAGHVTKVNVWHTHSHHAKKEDCIAKGKELVNSGVYKGYACDWRSDYRLWRLRVND